MYRNAIARCRLVNRSLRLPVVVAAALGVMLSTALPLAAQQGGPSSPAPDAQSDRLQNNIVVLLDTSGSMGQLMRDSGLTRMEAAKRALRQVLEQVPESTNVGLLMFSPRPSNAWAYPLGPANKQELLQAVQRPRPYGGTPLGAYLKVAADRLLQQRAAQKGYGTYRLLIVSDGEATDGYLLGSYLPDVLARGITIDVIGVDMLEDHALATQVHSYRRAGSAQQLDEAVQKVFAEVGAQGDDTSSQADFDLIAPLPEDTARVMLTALASSGNQPIGTRIDGDRVVSTTSAGSLPPPSSWPQPQPGSAPAMPSSSPSGSSHSSRGFSFPWVIVVAMVIAIIFGYMNHENKVRRRIRR